MAEMMSELNLQEEAIVTPVRAMGCSGAKRCEEAGAAQAEGENSGRDDERGEAAGGGESITPVRAMSCMREGSVHEAACVAQAEGENSGRDIERAEAAGGGERQAREGDELHARRAALGGLSCPSRGRERWPR